LYFTTAAMRGAANILAGMCKYLTVLVTADVDELLPNMLYFMISIF